MLQAGQHSLDSHAQSRGILKPKQRGAIRAVMAAPMAVGSEGSMNLAESLSLVKFLERYNDPARGLPIPFT